jgi:hypothetical protein
MRAQIPPDEPNHTRSWRLTFFGVADYRLRDFGEVIEFYVSREEAHSALTDVLKDEPEWIGELGVVPVEFEISPQ